MKINISWQYIAAFTALNMIMGELHEQVHINIGYLICGCYGPRDISVWNICEDCARPSLAFLATAAGPLFSCLLMWMGALMFIKNKTISKQSLGFSLLFANLPFARIFTALMGGGDEKVVIYHLLGESASILHAKMIASVVVCLICLPPVLIVARQLINHRRMTIITGFLTLPLILGMLYQKIFLNYLLKKGIADEILISGTPNLILIHFGIMIFILFWFRKNLFESFKRQPSPATNPILTK